MIYIRDNHNDHFRSGEWAHLFSIQHNEQGQDMWVVEFPDGAKDVWPSWDRVADYDVRVQIEPPEGEPEHVYQVHTPSSAVRRAAQQLLTQVP